MIVARAHLRPGRAAQRSLGFLAPLLLAASLSAQQTGTLTGRVVDDESREPVPDVLVRILETGLSTLTGRDGRFRIAGVPSGGVAIQVEHLAYGERLRLGIIPAGDSLVVQIGLTRRAIELAPVVVVGLTELEQRRVSTGNSMNEIHRPEIESAARLGYTLGQLLRLSMPGVRVRDGVTGRDSCVEYRGSVGIDGDVCRELSVYLDGVPVTMPAALIPNMPLLDIERLEVMSPGQAGALYGGDSGGGVLLIETRRGPRAGSQRPRADLVSGFDWSGEEQGYAWTRVVGGSLLGNAAGLALSMIAANRCFRIFRIRERDPNREVLGIDSRCDTLGTVATGFLMLELPGLGGTLAARWGGATDRTSGRIFPGMVLATVSAATGYLFIVQGGARNSAAATTAGMLILTVGTPALLTISDRGFRVLR